MTTNEYNDDNESEIIVVTNQFRSRKGVPGYT